MKMNSNQTRELLMKFTHIVPFLIGLMALISFVSYGIFGAHFYNEYFATKLPEMSLGMAILFVVVKEGSRLILLISSATDFLHKNYWGGALGVLASIGLVIFEWREAIHVAQFWSPDSPTLFVNSFRFLIVMGLILEFRVILMLSNSEEKEQENLEEKMKEESENLKLQTQLQNALNQIQEMGNQLTEMRKASNLGNLNGSHSTAT